MNVLSLFSGIGAPELAWEPLGWSSLGVSEIDPFASAVLAQRFPGITNYGDVTKADYGSIRPNIIVFGSPCQSYSVAGKRAGLDDPRGVLALHGLRIIDRFKPQWVLFENVPGLLSSDGPRDFGAFLRLLGKCGYGFAYRILDAQYFGVPQRRRRVFVVGYLGDWRCAAAVLFECESMRRDTSQGEKMRKDTSGTISARTSGGGGLGTDFELNGGLRIAHALRAQAQSSHREDSDNFVIADTLTRGANQTSGFHGDPIVMAHGQANAEISENGITPTLNCNHETQIVAFAQNQHGEIRESKSFSTLNTSSNATGRIGLLRISDKADVTSSLVRRITPVEAERLQGFPDNWTLIDWSKRASAKKIQKDILKYLARMGFSGKELERMALCPDGPRYKAIGNSMAVPVLSWIGRRIAFVESLKLELHGEREG